MGKGRMNFYDPSCDLGYNRNMNQPTETRRFCEQCGASLTEGGRYCEACGAPVPGLTVAAMPSRESDAHQSRIVSPTHAPEPGDGARVAGRWRWIVGLAVSLLLAAVGAISLLRFQEQPSHIDLPLPPQASVATTSPLVSPAAPRSENLAPAARPAVPSEPSVQGRDRLNDGSGLPSGLSGDDELAVAQLEFNDAYEVYTRLVTIGGTGDVKAALIRYRQAYERLQQVKADPAPR